MPETTIGSSLFLKDPSGLGAGEDPFKYDAFRKAVGDIATQTKQVNAPAWQPYYEGAKKTGLFSTKGPMGPTSSGLQLLGAVESYKTQTAVKQQEAEKAALALRLQGATTEASMRRLQELSQEAYGRRATATEAWGAAGKKAGEYVQSAELRTRQALNRLDEINAGISEGRDFAKAHAMNAAVQGIMGAMKVEEDQIVQRFGIGSKEQEQFRARKMQTLSTAQSQIETSYRQLAEQQSLTYMNASNELQWKEDMYASFQEQQHVETLRYLAQANDAYDMQLSQFNLTIEQLRSSGMENMANWMVQTPVFSMDIQPLATLIADLLATEQANRSNSAGGVASFAGSGGRSSAGGSGFSGAISSPPIYSGGVTGSRERNLNPGGASDDGGRSGDFVPPTGVTISTGRGGVETIPAGSPA